MFSPFSFPPFLLPFPPVPSPLLITPFLRHLPPSIIC
jgi:hypothetical protein